MRGTRLLTGGVVIGVVAVGLLAFGTVSGSPTGAPSPTPSATPLPTDPLAKSLVLAQIDLKSNPSDYQGWAYLAIDYVSLAKATVDPSYYLKAEGAVATSLRLNSTTNDTGYAAQAGLKAAEHQFYDALAAAEHGLRINPYNSTLYGALADADTQLGRYAAATAAVNKMNALLPGVPAFTRASYADELAGDIPDSRAALVRAQQSATEPGDVAFADYYLGELDINYGGNAKRALADFSAGLKADPTDYASQEGVAKALAALGRTKEALADYETLVSAVPQPQYVIEYGELLEATGNLVEAKRQYDLFNTEEALFKANHVVLDTDPTLYEADHGSPAKALKYAVAGWKARPFLEMADAYAWAEYANRNYKAALGWSDKAFQTKWPNALFHYHRGMIEKALGQKAAAKADLELALQINPFFNPLEAPRAKQVLATL